MNYLKWSLQGLAIGAVVLCGIQHLFMSFYWKPKMDKATTKGKAILSTIIADAKLVSSDPVFRQLPRNRNAETLLSQYLSMNHFEEEIIPAPKKSQLLTALFMEHKDWSKSDESLKKLLEDQRLSELDTSWLEKLKEFDHWDYGAHSEVKKRIDLAASSGSLERSEILLNLPHPDARELTHWTIAHILKKHQEGNVLQGLETSRHVAALLHSVGMSLLSSAFVSYHFQKENLLVERLRPEGWIPVSSETLAAYKRLYKGGWMTILQMGWEKSIPEDILPYMVPEAGICGPASELHINSPVAFYDWLAPQFIKEVQTAKYVDRAMALRDGLLEECGIASLRPLSGIPKVKSQSLQAHFPYARKMAGLYLLLPRDFTLVYEKESGKVSSR